MFLFQTRKRTGFSTPLPMPNDRYLTASAAQKLRADIRAEQKADWDYWANRVTLALALIGSIFGVLAFFKK
jgi:hypothetical protein